MKFKLGQKVIVNTGGGDIDAIIDYPIVNIHGYYWKEQDCYLCRFTTEIKNTITGGGVVSSGFITRENVDYVTKNSQYIPSKYIKNKN